MVVDSNDLLEVVVVEENKYELEQEEEEVVLWGKDMAQLGHGLELIQLKSTIAQIYQGRPNPFKDGFPGKSRWFGFKKGHLELVL